MANAEEGANQIIAEAVKTHGVLPVLCPWKSHRSAATGSEYGARNQAILEAAKLKLGFESTAWAPKATVERGGGAIKPGEKGVTIFACSQDSKEVDKLGADGKPIINPETGDPEKVKEYFGPKRAFAMQVFNLEQVENYLPPHKPMSPEPGRRLPAAISSIWRELAMDKPVIAHGNEMSYDIATDTFTLPSRDVVKDYRQNTLSAFELTRHMAFAAGHPKRLDIPMFHDPAQFAANQPLVEIATAAAATMYMQKHCEKWDPKIVEEGGLAEVKNQAQSVGKTDFMSAMKMAQGIYMHMAYNIKPGKRAAAA